MIDDLITQFWAIVADHVAAIATTPENAGLLVLSWGLVEAFAPLFAVLVELPEKGPTRLAVYRVARAGKRVAATLWCLILVWVPYAQPPLCEGPPADGCHTVIQRLTTAVVLGGVLSLGHYWVARGLRRIRGGEKSRRVICANCHRAVALETLQQPCPNCGKPPHEVTRT